LKKPSEYNFLDYLKQVYGGLPLEPFLGKSEQDGALDIGTFTIEEEILLQAARDNDDVFDYLINWYNQDAKNSKARIDNFRNKIPFALQWRFSHDLWKKEKELKFALTISQIRLRYISHNPLPDEKQLSLSQINSEIAIHKAKFLQTQFRPEIFFFKQGGFKTLFPFGNRQRNVQILGGAGSGKSEMLKLFIYSDLQNGIGNFLLDPHGDISMEVAKFMISLMPLNRHLYRLNLKNC